MTGEDRYTRGLELLAEINASSANALFAELQAVAPDMARYIAEFAYGDVWSRKGLSKRDKAVATIAGLTALGHSQRELRAHVRNALNVGLTPQEIVETLIHMGVYAGFPAAINAILTAREEFEARGLLPLEET
ncbi:MAG: carboxymuconolactone decarboxylase family protein [Pseudomonadota bacterium]